MPWYITQKAGGGRQGKSVKWLTGIAAGVPLFNDKAHAREFASEAGAEKVLAELTAAGRRGCVITKAAGSPRRNRNLGRATRADALENAGAELARVATLVRGYLDQYGYADRPGIGGSAQRPHVKLLGESLAGWYQAIGAGGEDGERIP